MVSQKHRCKKTVFYVCYYFYKIAFFNGFLFFGTFFLFSSGDIFYPAKPAKILLNLLNGCIKQLLSDGFNMAAIKSYLTKSRRPQTLSCILRPYFFSGIFQLA